MATHHVQHRAAKPGPAVSKPPAPIYVPNLVGSAFVFAKVGLSDSGLNWRVCGPVEGYSSNIVVRQFPAAGTAVDGASPPVVRVWLERNHEYPQLGAPDEASAAPTTC
jgi:beta-lactam-binding protein with PASTA domain